MNTLHKVAQLIIATMLSIGTALAEEKATQEAVNPFLIKPFQAPEALKDDLNEYRNNWIRLTGFDFSGLHWNQFVVIYANKGAEIYKNNYLAYISAYLDEDEEDEEEHEDTFVPYEVGTIFVKENYLATQGHPTKPLTLTTMIKRKPGFDPKNGDWEYIQSDVNGKIMLQGKAEDQSIYKPCGECHINMAERDYIFSTYYSEPQ